LNYIALALLIIGQYHVLLKDYQISDIV